MTSHQQKENEWSLDLQQQTRDAIDEMRCDPNGYLHFKHKLHGYAKAEVSDLLTGKYILKNKNQNISYTFSDRDGIVKSGWCAD